MDPPMSCVRACMHACVCVCVCAFRVLSLDGLLSVSCCCERRVIRCGFVFVIRHMVRVLYYEYHIRNVLFRMHMCMTCACVSLHYFRAAYLRALRVPERRWVHACLSRPRSRCVSSSDIPPAGCRVQVGRKPAAGASGLFYVYTTTNSRVHATLAYNSSTATRTTAAVLRSYLCDTKCST